MINARDIITHLFLSTVHDLISDLLDILLHSFGFVFVLETEGLVLDDLRFLFLECLG